MRSVATAITWLLVFVGLALTAALYVAWRAS